MDSPAVTGSEDPAPRAARRAGDIGVGLDGQHQPARLPVHIDDMPAGRVQQGVRTCAPATARTTGTVVHVEAFTVIVGLVALDREGLDPLGQAPPRRPAPQQKGALGSLS
jgi:hypothetical protein